MRSRGTANYYKGGGSTRVLSDGTCLCGVCRSCRDADRAAGMPVNDPERPIRVEHVRVRDAMIEDRTPSSRAESQKALRQKRMSQRIKKDGHWFAPGVDVHGTFTAYNTWGCHCANCRQAGAEEHQRKVRVKAEKEKERAKQG